MKHYLDVEVPEEGDLTREQGWALLSKLELSFGAALSRLGASVWAAKDAESPLTAEEREEIQTLQSRLKTLTRYLRLDVLERLAALSEAESEEERLWSTKAAKKFPIAVRNLLDNYHGDVYRYCRSKDGDPRLMALVTLEHKCDLEPSDIHEIIKKYWEPDNKHGDVWTCPQCDDYNPGKIGELECKRCYGWGYVFGEKVPDDQYDWSEKGRLALNNGEEWTPEQESAEQARLKAENDVCYKCGQPFDAQTPCGC